MKRNVVLSPLLVVTLALGGVFYHVGFQGEEPSLGLRFLFPVDFGDIKALADLGIGVSVRGTNIFLKGLEKTTPMKLVFIDLDEAEFSYGPLRPSLPFGFWKPNPDDWVFKVGSSWIILSKDVSLWSDTGILGVQISKDRWRMIGRPLDWLGFGYDSESGPFLALRFEALELEVFERAFEMSLLSDGFTLLLSFRDSPDISLCYMGEGEYVIIGNEGFEFVKKVGSIYVSGGFHEKTPSFSIEYPVQF